MENKTEETQEKKENIYEISFVQEGEDVSLLKDILAKHGGTILEEYPLTKIRLAYEINKASQGFLGVIKFSIDSDKLQKFSDALRLDGGSSRFIIRRKDKDEDPVTPDMTGKRRRKPQTEPESLSNEALEKKIEEILQ